MAKDKKASKAATLTPKSEASKPIESVKAGRVTKPSEKPVAVAKDAAKKVAKQVEKGTKKAKREPTPVSSDDEGDDTSDSSVSSDGGSESESDDEEVAPKKADAPKINGSAKAAQNDDDSSSASDSDDDDAAPKVNGKSTAPLGDDDDSDSSDSDSDGEGNAKAGAKVNGGVNGIDGDSSDDSGSDSEIEKDAKVTKGAIDSSDASSSDEDEDDEEEVVKTPAVADAGKKRKADEATPQTQKKTKVMIEGEQKDATANLFVGNLSWNVDEEWLTREFEEYGEIKGVRIITDRESGRSKGFGYVEFNEVDDAVSAVEAKQGAQLDGRNIRVDFSVPRPAQGDRPTPQQRSTDRAQRYGDTPKEPSSTLFVGNVSFNADESSLTELFQDYGSIKSVRLPTDRESGQMKGFGYVEFTSIDEAVAAFEGLQGAEVEGRSVRLDYASARPNNDSPRGGGGRGRGGFGDRGGRGGRGGFNDRGRGRGGARGGRGGTTNRGGFGDFSGKKMTF